MRDFKLEETVLYTITIPDEDVQRFRENLLWCGATDAEVVTEAVARGWVDLANHDSVVLDTNTFEM